MLKKQRVLCGLRETYVRCAYGALMVRMGSWRWNCQLILSRTGYGIGVLAAATLSGKYYRWVNSSQAQQEHDDEYAAGWAESYYANR